MTKESPLPLGTPRPARWYCVPMPGPGIINAALTLNLPFCDCGNPRCIHWKRNKRTYAKSLKGTP